MEPVVRTVRLERDLGSKSPSTTPAAGRGHRGVQVGSATLPAWVHVEDAERGALGHIRSFGMGRARGASAGTVSVWGAFAGVEGDPGLWCCPPTRRSASLTLNLPRPGRARVIGVLPRYGPQYGLVGAAGGTDRATPWYPSVASGWFGGAHRGLDASQGV